MNIYRKSLFYFVTYEEWQLKISGTEYPPPPDVHLCRVGGLAY